MVLPYHLPHWKSPDGKIILFNCDYKNLIYFLPDNFGDILIADPPYGIDAGNIFSSAAKRQSGKCVAMKSKFRQGDWDKEIPAKEYYDQVFRITKNQIIWGANYMVEHLPNSQGWIVWDKDNGSTNFADCELAFTSFNKATRIFKFRWNGMLQGNMKEKEFRIHPTQKPVQLYKYCILKNCQPGELIIDTHIGSGNICIAVDGLNKIEAMNLRLIGCEIDPFIFNDAILNIQNKCSQLVDYRPEEKKQEIIQNKLFTD